MSTFKELVQELHEVSGAAGGAPATTINLTGEALRLRNYVIRADKHIKNLWQNWRFLWDNSFSYNTVAGTQTYTAPATLGKWDHKTFRIDGDLIEVVEYEDVRSEYFSTAVADRAKPSRIIIRPDNSLQFDPVPDGAYTITADQWIKAKALGSLGTVADDSEISAIPEVFHQAIIGKALWYYGKYENSEDAQAHGEELWSDYIVRLEASQLPNKFGAYQTSYGNTHIEVIAE